MSGAGFFWDADRLGRMFCHPIRTAIGEVAVRPILPVDADLVQAFVGGLSSASRYFRFFQPVRCLPPAMLERFTRVDGVSGMALVGVASVQGSPAIVGEVRYALNSDSTSADIAMVVSEPWQRRGIATGMLSILECMAAATGITSFTGETLVANEACVRFARACGFQVRPDTADRSFVRIEKPVGVGDSI